MVHHGMPSALPLTYAALEIGDALMDRLGPILARAGLTPAQFKVLYALIEEGPMKLSVLAERQRCVKSNVSYITRVMQTEGLVVLVASEEDARARVMTATKSGRQRYEGAKGDVQKFEAVLRRKLGPAVVEQLTRACLEAATAIDAL